MPPLRPSLMPGALGVVVASASVLVPISYDEGNWLAVVRRIALGETLYQDITDNKTPSLFGLVRGLDALPGPYPLARGIWLGIAAAIVAAIVRFLVERAGWDERRATLLGVVFGIAAAAQAVLTVNFELPAVVLFVVSLAAITTRREILGGVLAASATTFDIRAIALIPGVALYAYAIHGRRGGGRTVGAAGLLSAVWAVTVIVLPDLRYSLIELNAATRGGAAAWQPGDQLYSLVRGTLIPAGALLAINPRVVDRRVLKSGLALSFPAAIVALLSLRPFDKYWTLLLPGLAVIAMSFGPSASAEGSKRRRPAAAIAILGLVLATAYAISSNIDQREIEARYERAAAVIDGTLRPSQAFVRFDTQPFLGVFLPERDRLPAAVLDFLIADTSRRSLNNAQVEEAIRAATLLVDDGALSVPESWVLPQYRPLRRVFVRHLSDFPCVRRVEGLTLRYRATACPSTAPG